MDELKVIIKTEIDQNSAISSTKKAKRQIEDEFKKTPIQVKIETSTGIATQEMSKAAKSYQTMWEKAIKQRELAELKSLQTISQQSNKQFWDNFDKEIGIGRTSISAKSVANVFDSIFQVEDKAILMQNAKNKQFWDNFNKGLNINATSKSARESASVFEKAFSGGVDKASIHLKKLNPVVGETDNMFKKLSNSLTHNFSKIVEWTIAGTAVFGTLRAIQSGIQYITDMDTALTNLTKVVDLSTKQMNEMRGTAISLGKELGKSSVDIMNSMAEFGRITKNTDEIKNLTKTAVMASNVTSLSAAEAAKSLTTSMISFGIETKDSMKILDQFNELQNNYRVSAEDLADSIGVVGSAAKQAGVSMAELNGMTTTLVSATGIQGSEAGTALKSIISRVFRLGKDGEDDAGKSEELLNSLGIAVRNAKGDFLSFEQVLNQINEKWDSYHNKTKMNIAQTLAGTMHYSKFISLMDNYNLKINATTTALNSENSAMIENQKYLQSIEGRLQQLKTTLEGAFSNLISSDLFKYLISDLTLVIDKFFNFKSIIVLATTALLVFKGTAIFQTVSGFITFIIQENLATIATVGFTSVINACKTALNTLWGAIVKNPLGALAIVITSVASAMIFMKAKHDEAVQSFITGAESIVREQNNLIDLTEQYKQLSIECQTNATAKSQLSTVEDNLKKAIGETSSAIDFQNGKIDENIEKIRSLSREKLQDFLTTNEFYAIEAQENLKKKTTHTYGVDGTHGTNQSPFSTLSEYTAKLKNDIDNETNYYKTAGGIAKSYSGHRLDKLKQEYDKINKEIETNKKTIDTYNAAKEALEKLKNPKASVKTTTTDHDKDEIKRLQSDLEKNKKKTKSTGYVGTSTVSEALIEKDRYYQLNQELTKTNNLLDKNKALQETSDLKTKVDLMYKEKDLLKQKQIALHNIADENRRERDELVSKLSSSNYGFKFTGKGDSLSSINGIKALESQLEYVNLHQADKNKTTFNRLKAEYTDMKKSYDRFIEIQLSELPKAQTEWQRLSKDINSVSKELQEQSFKLAKDVIESQKQLAEIELKNQSLPHENKIKELETENDKWKEKIDSLEKAVDLEKQITEDKNRQLEIERQRQALDNVNKEKNVQIYDKSVGRFVWSVDPRKVKEEKEKLEKLEKDYTEYKRDERLKHDKQLLQDQIDANNKTIKQEEETLKTLKDNFDKTWQDIESMSQKLLDTYCGNIKKAIEILSRELATNKSQLLSMASLPPSVVSSNSSAISSTGGYASSSSSDFKANATAVINGVKTDAMIKGGTTYLSNGKSLPSGSSVTSWSTGQTYKKYETGGLNTQPGLHILDGTVERPELVLNPNDTKNMLTIVDIVRNIVSPKIPHIINGGSSSGKVEQYNFNKEIIVQTNDATDFINKLKRQVRSS